MKAINTYFLYATQSFLASSLHRAFAFEKAFQFTLEHGQRMTNSSSVFGWAHDLHFIKGCVEGLCLKRKLKEGAEVWGNYKLGIVIN